MKKFDDELYNDWAAASKPGNQSSIPMSHSVEGKNPLLRDVLWPPLACCNMGAPPLNKCNKNILKGCNDYLSSSNSYMHKLKCIKLYSFSMCTLC